MNRFPINFVSERCPSDDDLDRQHRARQQTALIERDMKYGPCSHCWSEPDKDGIQECQWCYARDYALDKT